MINKKNVLGRVPKELGVKDAIHTAIVSVRAASMIHPGAKIKMNEWREAEEAGGDEKYVGVADPFLRQNVATGEWFWLLLSQDAVPNVQHVWEHPKVNFDPPDREPVLNETLQEYAVELGLTYTQLMEACAYALKHDGPAPYKGKLSAKELEDVLEYKIESSEMWWNYAQESGFVFENQGSACCPEYSYPRCLFEY